MPQFLFLAIAIGAMTIVGYAWWIVMRAYANAPPGPLRFDLWEIRKQILIWFLLVGIEIILLLLTAVLRK
jgi:hypothetical protein